MLRKTLVSMVIVVLPFVLSGTYNKVLGQSGIAATKHNLSASGSGDLTATSEDRICLFCHTPHQGSAVTAPLWNRDLSSAGYTPYASSSMQSLPGQPNGYSKLCLSCHDGTIALGSVLSRNGSPATIWGLEAPMSGVDAMLGTDLSNDHPVSFSFNAALSASDGELVDPATLTGNIHLWSGETPTPNDNLQCSSCHDAHEDRTPKFLRKLSTGQTDNLCLTCHDKTAWTVSTHGTSTTFYPSGQSTEMVKDYSCRSCHNPHSEIGSERLLDGGVLAGQSAIEETCYKCHQSAGAGGVAQDIKTEFTTKLSSHPVAIYQGHEPVIINTPAAGMPEGVLLQPGLPAPNPSFTDTKHIECTDCHNPHQATSANRTEGVKGIDLNGQTVTNVINDPELPDGTQKQYQLCLRCHGDSYASFIPQMFWGASRLRSMVGEPASGNTSGSNKRVEFDINDPANTAYHPVAGVGRNQSSQLQSQLSFSGLSTTSIIKCTDCHNSDAAGSVNGRASNTSSGTLGPHGSTYGRLLRSNYVSGQPPLTPPMNDNFGWNSNNFSLCFRCHNSSAFSSRGAGNMTNYYSNDRDNLHFLHLEDLEGRNGYGAAVCSECHYNLHSNREAANTNYEPPPDGDTHLINFAPSVSGASQSKPLWFYLPPNTDRFGRGSEDRRTMACNLRCHGETHNRVDEYFYEWRPS